MTTKRIAVLVAVVTFGLSGVFLLPKSAAQPFGVKLELPATIGDWWGTEAEVLQKERDTLGPSTEFARKSYKNHMHEKLPGYSLLVSMVLSGHDMSNSIHRPERCLSAQGWSVLDSEVVNIGVPGKGAFPATRLYNRSVMTGRDGKPIEKDGKPVIQNAYSYYWFVGENEITSSHWGRFFQDNSDRLFRGVNQRWAFITVTGKIAIGTNAEPDPRLSAEVDRTLRKFISELAPHIHTEGLSYSR
jgi:Protein of unknown function (DUF3485)